MGDQTGVDRKHNRVTLYCGQSDNVVSALRENGAHFAKMKYIREKYEEVADVFVTAYNWYNTHASRIVPKPDEAESGIWAYGDIRLLEKHEGYTIMELEVPTDQAVFFRMSDWNKVLNMRYMGENPEEERDFGEKLRKYGIRYEGDVVMKPFYPQLKQEVVRSWDKLFRFHDQIRDGEAADIPDVQAGLWVVRKEWVVNWDC